MNATQQIHGYTVKAHGTSEPIPDASGTGMIEIAAPSGALCCDAMVGPLAQRHWKAPFRYDPSCAYIWDASGELALDVRGWGHLTGTGSEALALSEEEAAKIQDDFGESVVRVLNASWPNPASEPR